MTQVHLTHVEGPLRIYKGTLPYPGLVVTRSFGDFCAAEVGVTATPKIETLELTLSSEWHCEDGKWSYDASPDTCDFALVLASDGLWDAISKNGVSKVCGRYYSRQDEDTEGKRTPPTQVEKCTRHLVSYAVKQLLKTGEVDNVTCTCIFLGDAQ